MDDGAHCSKDASVPNLTQLRQHPSLVAIGKAIRTIRRKKNISQEQLALQAGIDRSYMGRIERGDNNAAILTLEKISMALEMSLSELLAYAGL